MATKQVIIEFISDTSQLGEGEKKLLDIQQKTAAAVNRANIELAKQTQTIGVTDAASKKLAATNLNNSNLYQQLTKSLQTTTG
jgi:hypothetical protein